jgi:hypothetical protein
VFLGVFVILSVPTPLGTGSAKKLAAPRGISPVIVIPAKAGIQGHSTALWALGPGFRRGDDRELIKPRLRSG